MDNGTRVLKYIPKIGIAKIFVFSKLPKIGLKTEFNNGRNWVRDHFDLSVSNKMISGFETVIRFLGGLLGAYHMSGDSMLLEKAKDVALALETSFKFAKIEFF